MIEIKYLEKKFNGHRVLKNINLTINKKDKIAIIGPSGSGKSTLLRCLNLLEKPNSGTILFNNIDITNSGNDINKIRQKMNMVFQYFNLFNNKTVLENLTIAPIKLKNIEKEKAIKRAMEALSKVGLERKKDCYPKQLSGGQKQRIAILRAILMDPEVILFDEPTSSLDPEMVKEVLNMIEDLSKSDITIVCVTHELNFAKNMANRIIFLCDGRIEAQGTPEEIFNNQENERLKNFLNNIKNKN